MDSIYFATSNQHKYEEVKNLIENEVPLKIVHFPVDLIEIQDSSASVIAKSSLLYTDVLKSKNNIFVEDSGIQINALNGFPGPYSSYIFSTIGLKGIIKLLNNVQDRSANFISVIALKINNQIDIFEGTIKGEISETISEQGWGYDPIFIPEGKSCTFGELGKEKLTHSHRYRSTVKLIDFLKQELS